MASQTSLERPLPHYLLAERTLLGVILLNNTALVAAIEKGLRPEDFFLPENRNVFEAFLRLDEERTPIDTVTLAENLVRHGKLDSSGGHAYIAQLSDGIPRGMNVQQYAQIIKEKAVLRSLIHATASIQENAFDSGQSVDDILDEAERAIFG